MSTAIKRFQCGNCGHIIEVPRGTPKSSVCPRCGAPSAVIHQIDKGPPCGCGSCGR